MKKAIILVVFCVLTVHYGFSQVFIGGGISIQNSSTELGNTSIDRTFLEISPVLGFRFGNFDIGGLFLFQNESMEDADMRNLGFGIFGNYNFFTTGKFSILGRANFMYINSQITENSFITITSPPY